MTKRLPTLISAGKEETSKEKEKEDQRVHLDAPGRRPSQTAPRSHKACAENLKGHTLQRGGASKPLRPRRQTRKTADRAGPLRDRGRGEGGEAGLTAGRRGRGRRGRNRSGCSGVGVLLGGAAIRQRRWLPAFVTMPHELRMIHCKRAAGCVHRVSTKLSH